MIEAGSVEPASLLGPGRTASISCDSVTAPRRPTDPRDVTVLADAAGAAAAGGVSSLSTDVTTLD